MSHWHEAGFGTDPEGDAVRRAEPADLPVLTDAIRRTAHLVPPLAAEVLTSEPDPHAVIRRPYPWGVAWTCACGRWEAVATGPSSAAWAGADHARHARDEEAGARGE